MHIEYKEKLRIEKNDITLYAEHFGKKKLGFVYKY